MTFEQIYNQMRWTREPERVEMKDGVIPKDITVRGFIIDSVGALEEIN